MSSVWVGCEYVWFRMGQGHGHGHVCNRFVHGFNCHVSGCRHPVCAGCQGLALVVKLQPGCCWTFACLYAGVHNRTCAGV
jgi:hypothetical protein